MDEEPPPFGLQCLAQPFLAAAGEGADAFGEVDLVGVGLGDDSADLLDQVAGADHQPSAAFPEGVVEVGEAVGEEGRPVGCGEPGLGDGVVPDEERHDGVGRVEGGPQRGLVVQPQVGGEQDDGDGHDALSGRAVGGVQGEGRETVPSGAVGEELGAFSSRAAVRAMLRAMPPKTTAWKGETDHQYAWPARPRGRKTARCR